MKRICFMSVLLIGFACCTRSVSDLSDLERSAIDSVITHNDSTIIYLWTDWCSASQDHFIKDVVPYLQQKSGSIGFISIFYGKEDKLASILSESNCSYPTYRIDSKGGLDKYRMSKLLKSFLRDYNQMDYVPVSVLCDRKGNILNYDETTKEYSGIVNCILSVGGNPSNITITYDTILPIEN